MTKVNDDLIITTVRNNRIELLADFGGNAGRFIEYLISLKPEMENAGWCYESIEQFEERKAWHRKQKDEQRRSIEALSF